MSLKEDYEKAQALTAAAKAELDKVSTDYDAKWHEHPVVDYTQHAKEISDLGQQWDCLNRKVIEAERMEANLKDRLTWECLRNNLNAAARERKR